MPDARDALARSLRDERLIASRFEWESLDEGAREEWRRRSDHVVRLLQGHGYTLAKAGDEKQRPAYEGSPTIITNQLVPDPGKQRSVRFDGDKWSIEVLDKKTEAVTVEQTFTMEEGVMLSGMVMAGDPDAAKRVGLGRLLAAMVEIYRLNADGMGVTK